MDNQSAKNVSVQVPINIAIDTIFFQMSYSGITRVWETLFKNFLANKDNKNYKSSNEDLFKTSLSFIPANKRFNVSDEIRKMLSELEHQGTTFQAIGDEFSKVNWDLIDNPRVFVLGRLRDLVARPVHYTPSNQPPKCANPDCDEKTRTLPYSVEVPNGNGQSTRSCLECNHYWVNKRNGFS